MRCWKFIISVNAYNVSSLTRASSPSFPSIVEKYKACYKSRKEKCRIYGVTHVS